MNGPRDGSEEVDASSVWRSLERSHLLDSQSGVLADGGSLVEKASGCGGDAKLDARVCVCELSVEKEANDLMHFPLMENRSVCPRVRRQNARRLF